MSKNNKFVVYLDKFAEFVLSFKAHISIAYFTLAIAIIYIAAIYKNGFNMELNFGYARVMFWVSLCMHLTLCNIEKIRTGKVNWF